MSDTTSIRRDAIFIDGQWVKSAGNETIDVIDTATEQVMGSIPAGTGADVDRAVLAARKAFGHGRSSQLTNARSISKRSPRGSRPGRTRSRASSPAKWACRSSCRSAYKSRRRPITWASPPSLRASIASRKRSAIR
jgi:hypothetical protein